MEKEYKSKIRVILRDYKEVQEEHEQHRKSLQESIQGKRRVFYSGKRGVPSDHPDTYRFIMMGMGFTDERIERYEFKDDLLPEQLIENAINEIGLLDSLDMRYLLSWVLENT